MLRKIDREFEDQCYEKIMIYNILEKSLPHLLVLRQRLQPSSHTHLAFGTEHICESECGKSNLLTSIHLSLSSHCLPSHGSTIAWRGSYSTFSVCNQFFSIWLKYVDPELTFA